MLFADELRKAYEQGHITKKTEVWGVVDGAMLRCAYSKFMRALKEAKRAKKEAHCLRRRRRRQQQQQQLSLEPAAKRGRSGVQYLSRAIAARHPKARAAW